MMENADKYNIAFRKALETLNEAQLRAVEQIEGPVLVIAGPGTGKTQILAARIGRILSNTDTDPHNILCLTYTDAGAVAMRRRLFQFIGPDAWRVNIYTFHAFCNDIIQENLDYFGKLSLDAISDLEQIALFRKLIDSFPANHVLKRFRGDAYYEISGLKDLFSIMKRENWQPDFVCQKAGEYLQAIRDAEPDSPYFKKFKYKKPPKAAGPGAVQPGDLKPAFDDEVERMERLKAAACEFPNYQRLMREMGRYDFDDMISWILEAFKTDPNFLLNYQEKYQYVLLDEYQDTSGAQNELIRLLVSYWDTPNIFVVGDDDQSIFRFQGANVENIEQYHTRYARDLYSVMLLDNYRSTQPILDAARVLIEHNTERIRLPGLSKHLLAKNSSLAKDVLPEIHEYQTQLHEFAGITRQVKKLLDQGLPPAEIAIIYKEHRIGEELMHYFRLENIPVSARKKLNVLKTPFGQKLLNILRYLSLETEAPYSGDELLFHIMHYDFYGISPLETAKICVAVNRQNRAGKEQTAIRRHIAELAAGQQSLFQAEGQAEIARLSNDIEYWIKAAENLTLQNLFEKIVLRGGILGYVLRSPDKNLYLQILSALFNFLKEESRRHPEMNLAGFMRQIDLLEEHELPLEVSQVIFNEQGVNFLTCHGSKGLEFDQVFLLGCNSQSWEKKKKRASGYKLPDTVFSSARDAGNEEELRRLFYVAITRARSHLHLSYCRYDAAGKELEHSVFLAEIMAGTGLQPLHREVPEEELLPFFALNFSEEEKPAIGLIDKNLVDSVLQNYALSVTHLSNYLECPLRFYFQNLLQIPRGKTESLTFGSAIHWALEVFFRKVKEEGEFPPKEQLQEDFGWYMNKNRESFTAEQYARRMEYGKKILPDYYDRYIEEWPRVIIPEITVRNVEIGGVPIKGKIDKLEFDGKSVNVVDYKTGRYKNAKEKLKSPDEKNPNGGDYWRQAVFYKILIDNDHSRNWTALSSEFDFVEPENDEYIKHKIFIRPEDIEIVTGQIKDTYARIRNYEFDTGCGKKDCEWCNFVRSNFRDLPQMPAIEDEEQ
ncbi:DNA helicase-2/ATP-dependent DNA helicase PcrA [Anseongella ginsenosidimutans]|uniref:DNA 3'-5' helicase n=1 Tax=Anseongella ginsenosidimutans TaxID=496056 RepID=A0A4V2UTE5_9SPHI|nr:ATP-dependent DNA helicase [Anseongella ginsenosidimutans]QEC52019.1 ATP-dependent helicase [Anseongella ginsenosidimutans]TCS85676.1 DNA helicase-2/ATP-dependent DNA helicase PcrA [Anseongella ginsenosidimutans]